MELLPDNIRLVPTVCLSVPIRPILRSGLWVKPVFPHDLADFIFTEVDTVRIELRHYCPISIGAVTGFKDLLHEFDLRLIFFLFSLSSFLIVLPPIIVSFVQP